MSEYLLIFLNSLKASIITSLYAENAWFAALSFGSHDLLAITVAAVLGSGLGNALNFGLGYYLGRRRSDWFVFNDTAYAYLSKACRYWIILLLFPFQAVPVIGVFWSLFVLATGFFCDRPGRALAFLLTGRVLFYLYYIFAG